MSNYLPINWFSRFVCQAPKKRISICFSIALGLYLLILQPGYSQPKPYDFVANINKYRLALKTEQNIRDRAHTYFQLANYYAVTNEDSATYFASLGIPIAEKLVDKHLLVNLYGELGRSYESRGKTSEGLTTLKKAEEISQRYLKDSTTALIQLMLANFYTKQGQDSQALPKALAALRYQEMYSPDKKIFLCKIYNTLGIIYSNLKNEQEAIRYYEKLKEVGATLIGGYYVYLAAVNIADSYTILGNYEKAEVSARQALAKAKELKTNRGIGFGYGNLSDIMYKMKRYPEALEYATQSLQVRQQGADKRLIGLSQLTLAQIYLAMNDYKQAVVYGQQAVTNLRATNDRLDTKLALEIKADILEKTGNYRDAFATYKEAKVLNDSLTNVENVRESSRIQGSFDLERKQSQIQLLNKNLSIQQLQAAQRQKQLLLLNQAKHTSELKNQLLSRKEQLNQSQLKLQAIAAKRQDVLITQQQNQLAFAQQQRLLYLTISALLVVLISVIGYFFNRQQKAKQLLSSQKEEIQQQALRLTELNATKDKLFSLISHDLRSPVGSLKTGIQQLREMDKQPKLLPLMSRLENQVNTVLTLLTNLLDWSLVQLKGFQVLLQPILLDEVMLETISQASDLIQQKQLMVINQVDKSHKVMADKHQLWAVVRNVLSNAIKFTPRGGFIRIHSVCEGQTIELQIRDSGLGMSAEQLAMLFSSPQVRTGTMGESGTGLGLQICREMLDRQGGSIQIESPAKGGTLVRIRLIALADQLEPVLS